MTNILIADDHELVRDTIAAYLNAAEDFRILTAGDLAEAEQQLAGEYSIDLLVLDYNMPGMNGLQGLTRICQAYPNTRVVLMSGVATRDVATEAMDRGAQGFLPKSLSANSFINAIRFVLSGERYFPFDFSQSRDEEERTGRFSALSAREMQTLKQLGQGLSNKEIARELGIQEVTVKLHMKNILTKLGATNRTQAALMAREALLI